MNFKKTWLESLPQLKQRGTETSGSIEEGGRTRDEAEALRERKGKLQD